MMIETMKFGIIVNNVKLADSASPFKFRQIKFTQKNVKKLGLEDD